MLFMAQIRTRIPYDLPPERSVELLEAERRRGTELVRTGKIRQIWRIAGALANFSVWEVDSPAELHDLLSSLPLFPFQEITITAVVDHPAMLSLSADD